jgi:Tetratricopeptide repeat
MYDLAQFWDAQGNHEKTRIWLVRALAIREQTLGEDHPKTMETRKYLHATLAALRNVEGAVSFDVPQPEEVEMEEGHER